MMPGYTRAELDAILAKHREATKPRHPCHLRPAHVLSERRRVGWGLRKRR